MAATAAGGGGTLAADTRPVAIEDIIALKYAFDPQVSPEGAWVAYTVYSNDQEKDAGTSRIWMASVDGTAELPMSGLGYAASHPRWSPDGKYLAFLAAKGDEAESQVWLLDRRGGEAQQYTKVEQGVDSFEWSPDGTMMLLTITDKKPEVEKNADGEEKAMPWVIDRRQFKEDGVGYLDRRRPHLYLFDGTNAPDQITFGDYDDSGAVWSPDGTRVAFTSNRTAEPDGNTNSDIWVVSADMAAKEWPLTQVTTNPGADDSPTWAPDGKSIAYATVTAVDKIWYATRHVAVSPATGGDARVLTAAYDRVAFDPAFAADGKSVYFRAEDDGQVLLAAVDVKSGKVNRIAGDGAVIAGADIAGKGVIAVSLSTSTTPHEIHALKKGKLTRLSHQNDAQLKDVAFADVREIKYKSADGTEVEAFFYLPPDYKAGTKYPTILRPHGGPVAQHDSGFYEEAQVLAAQGYVVIAPNPRGSSGYGEAFSHALFANWGEKDFEDVMAAVDYAIAQGWADPARLGVGGWSYGGILTNYVITKSDRFKAAISGASEVLYRANYGHDIYQSLWEAELGLPWETPEAWERITPFNNVGKVVTPTLVIGGKEDWNVPIQNSEQLYQALKRRGIDTQLVVYPGETHSISRPSFQKDRLVRYVDWYGRYLK